jgi:carbon starvation protein CstA
LPPAGNFADFVQPPMSLIAFLAVSAVILLLAYRWMGRALARVVGLDNALKTPAHVQRDGLDHEPARW